MPCELDLENYLGGHIMDQALLCFETALSSFVEDRIKSHHPEDPDKANRLENQAAARKRMAELNKDFEAIDRQLKGFKLFQNQNKALKKLETKMDVYQNIQKGGKKKPMLTWPGRHITEIDKEKKSIKAAIKTLSNDPSYIEKDINLEVESYIEEAR
jgi:predicted  nucleic acid-binding Zn-ribbon protein